MIGLIREYVSTLVRITSWNVVLSLGLMVGSGLMEGFGLLVLIPLLQVVGIDVQQGATGQIAEFMSTMFAAAGLPATLVSVLSVYVLIVTVQALFSRWQSQENAALQNHVVRELRQRLFRSIINARWIFLSRSRSSDFTYALTSEVARVGGATYEFLSLISQSLLASVYLVIALRISASMTGAALIAGVVLVLLLRRGVRVSRAVGEQASHASRQMYTAIGEYMGAMKTAKSYGAEHSHIALFSSTSNEVTQVANRAVRLHADTRAALNVGSVLILSVVLYLGVRVLGLPAAEILLLIFIFGRLVPRISNIHQSFQHFVGNLPAFATVMGAIARCEQAAEPMSPRQEGIRLHQEIRLEGVTFSYQTGNIAPTLADLTLVIPARHTTALVGPSGAGKSTVADLLMGLVMPESGQFYVDGVPLDPSRVHAWREEIGYVPQDTFLFHDSIRANLLWARPDAEEPELWGALRLAAADGFVYQLSEGLDTVVGDRGVRLSGGERQRIALARALLRKPSLLILDEATSALDSENERRIQQAIENLHGDITILIITHRLSTIRGADVIHVLENGRVVESGNWKALAAEPGGRFYALWSEQTVDISRRPAEPNRVVIT